MIVNLVQGVSKFGFLVYNTTPKNNLGRNLYNQMLLNCKFFIATHHSSLVDYLAQVINAKNCPTTFYCIF